MRIYGSIFRMFMLSFLLMLGGCNKELYRNLSQRDANEMLASLEKADLFASKELLEDGSYRLTIDEVDFGRAVTTLMSEGLPKESFKSTEDIFPGDKLILSPLEQKVRAAYARNQELSRSVATLQGVTEARVHLVVPETDIRGIPQGRAAASVVLKAQPDANLELVSAQAKTIVSNAVSGLSFNDVAVVISAYGGVTKTPQLSGGYVQGPADLHTSPIKSLGRTIFFSIGLIFGVACVAFGVSIFRQAKLLRTR